MKQWHRFHKELYISGMVGGAGDTPEEWRHYARPELDQLTDYMVSIKCPDIDIVRIASLWGTWGRLGIQSDECVELAFNSIRGVKGNNDIE